MTNDSTPGEYYCPYDACEYSAPTERQVRSHITLADHGEHDGIDGYVIGVEVPDESGELHSYENKNKVTLEDVQINHITDEVNHGKQVVLKLAYENPEKAYTELQEMAHQEGIKYTDSTVRRVIQTHLENVPDEASDTGTSSQDSPGEDIEPDPTAIQNPFTAAPDYGRESESADPQSSTDTETQTDDQSGKDIGSFDTDAIPDYWSENAQRIIAIYEALDDPIGREVHATLVDVFEVDVSESLVHSVLDGWTTKEYEELTDVKQQAVDALSDKREDESLDEVADRTDIPRGTLGYVRSSFPHILQNRVEELPLTRKQISLDPVPFEIRDELDDDSWSTTQQLIISGYEEYERPTDRELHEKLADNGVNVSQSTIQQTLSEYVDFDRRRGELAAHKKSNTDLTDRQQNAVDHLAKKPPEQTIQDLAEEVSETACYLYYINREYRHIVENHRETPELYS
ncbi:hypothetical protein [Halosimplex carlsbadense]|uniref:hypothetical protein n=1 Tax=Halosimplex carlsbadense TaxID=171164 RepID=UPI001268A2C8|nr:hypothetical protein [Halosimplex carlsbadense]